MTSVMKVGKPCRRGFPAKRKRSRAVRVRILTYLDDREDGRLAMEALREGGEPIPLESLIAECDAYRSGLPGGGE